MFLRSTVDDGYAAVVGALGQLIEQLFVRMAPGTHLKVCWFIDKLLTACAVGVDVPLQMLLRWVRGGDASPTNSAFAAKVLEILSKHVGWVCRSLDVTKIALFTVLRVMADHNGPELEMLQHTEARFCLSLVTRVPAVARAIGRDLVRLLQAVAHVAGVDLIWQQVLGSDPAAALSDLLAQRTPRSLVTSRITPPMEADLLFMLTKVHVKQQKRYQHWFAERYLATPEAETLVCDLIRFIICNYHPSNEVGCGFLQTAEVRHMTVFAPFR